jgi:hypothetical protein
MSTSEYPADGAEGLIHLRDPDDPTVVTLCEPGAEGQDLAERWVTVDERDLLDLAAWR